MKTNLIAATLCALTALSGAAHANEAAPYTLDWADYYTDRPLPEGCSLEQDPEHGTVLVVDVPKGVQKVVPLATIENPSIDSSAYKVSASIRYQGVEVLEANGQAISGYLEMWNHFGEKGSYFTRTLGEWGSMAKLAGDSSWRPVDLPFSVATDQNMRPKKLDINLALPAGGKVTISDLTLTSGAPKLSNGWAPTQSLGITYGIIGALFGVLGSVHSWSRSTGKGWQMMRYYPAVAYTAGAGFFTLSIVSLALDQPWGTTMLHAMMSVIFVGVMAVKEWDYRRSLHTDGGDAELRRMQAMDV